MSNRATPKRDVQWLDGLRGLASFTVVCTHLAHAFDSKLYWATDDVGIPPRILQYPVIRVIFQGNFGVTIFALLTGYVCALKPLRLARAGNHDAALSTISKGAFRRIPRLVLPATIALIIAWSIAQCGGFNAASHGDSEYLRESTGVPQSSMIREFGRLWENFLGTWTGSRVEYDDHQWTLLPLLKGSLTTFLLVAAVIYTRFRYRILIYFLYMGYWWQNNRPDTETFGQQIVWGVFLSDLSQSTFYKRFSTHDPKVGLTIATPLIIIGFYIASFPKNFMSAPLLPWSNTMFMVGEYLFPPGVDYSKRFNALGVQLISLGLQLSPRAQQLMANNVFLTLGRHSFAVYLIHGTLLRSLMAWALYGITGGPWVVTHDQEGQEVLPEWLPRRYTGVSFIIVTAMWLACVYYCAALWTAYVDSWCAKATQRLEELVCEPKEKDMQQMSKV